MKFRFSGNARLIMMLFMMFSLTFSTSVVSATTGFSIPDADLTVTQGESQTIHINLDEANYFYGLQLDLTLPEGLTMDMKNGEPDINILSPHQIYSNFIQEKNCYRLVAYHYGQPVKPFSSATNLITFNVTASSDFSGGEIKITDCVLVEQNPDGTAATFMETLTEDQTFSVVADIPEVEVESVTLDKTSMTIMDSESVTLKATINPSDATDQSLTWTSSEPTVAAVDANGVVTGKKAGSATIIATSVNGKTASCVVTVTATPATSVTITPPARTTLKVGETMTLTATVAPENATDKTVVWSSSNPTVATVDENGKVTALAYGTAKITAACGNVSDNVTFTVHNYITSLSLSATSLTIELDKSGKLEATCLPAQPEAVSLSWESSNPEVATVDNSGNITPKTVGQTVITVTDSYTHLSASCSVTVKDIRYGDVNEDDIVTVDDINLMISHILAKSPTPFNEAKADIDKNGRINIVDVTLAVTIALNENPAALRSAIEKLRAATRTPSPTIQLDAISLDANGELVLPLDFKTQDNMSAIQADVILPAGIEIVDAYADEVLSAKHSLTFTKLDDNTVRFMIYSPSLAPLAGDNIRLKLNVSEEIDLTEESLGEALVTNILASNPAGRGVPFDDFTVEIMKGLLGGIDGIGDGNVRVSAVSGAIMIKTETQLPVEIFTPAGVLVERFTSNGEDVCSVVKGLYLVVVDGQSYKVLVY